MQSRGTERILDLIEWLSARHTPATLAEASHALELAKSSVLLLLRTLVARGYVERLIDGCYRLVRLPGEPSPDAGVWGTILRIAEPILREAVAEANESGFVAVLTADDHVRYLNKILPDLEIRYDRNIARLRVPHQVASGIVLLGGLSPEMLEAYLARLDPAAPQRSDRPKEILRAIEQARADGYRINLKGMVDGAAGVSAPIVGQDGRILAAVNIAGPRDRLAANSDRAIAVTVEAARRVSRSLARRFAGASPPTLSTRPENRSA